MCQYDTLATRGRNSVANFLRYNVAGWTDLHNASEQAVAGADSSDKFEEWTVGLMRSLRSTIIMDGFTIDGGAIMNTTATFFPQYLEKPQMATDIPASSAKHVDHASVCSATAEQAKRVEDCGKDSHTTSC
ncbi:hypothetical protein FGADI_5735 [Fusarium gaditjirri]|uniref:Uncharacterized protein n=1 Tax=Fusarium gaditjirri TaxID=282569 RepID=A0A8H4T9T8_9HYPO|nr:hypothetical protein FGADI_5735 [Fusarium gaditjirri]